MQIRDLTSADSGLLTDAFGPDEIRAADEDLWGSVAHDPDAVWAVARVRTVGLPEQALVSPAVPELAICIFDERTDLDALLAQVLAGAQERGLTGLATLVDFGGPLAAAFTRAGFRTVGIDEGADLMVWAATR